jgi:hypothetical protein
MSEGSFGDVQSVPEMSGGIGKAQENGSKPLSLSSPLPIAADNSGTLTASGDFWSTPAADAYLASMTEGEES